MGTGVSNARSARNHEIARRLREHAWLFTLRGLKPVDAARLTYFLPWVAAYIIAFELMWWRWTVLRRRVVTQGDAP